MNKKLDLKGKYTRDSFKSAIEISPKEKKKLKKHSIRAIKYVCC